MKYVGLQTQISRNNLRSTLLLIGFPILLMALVYAFFIISNQFAEEPITQPEVDDRFFMTAPVVAVIVMIWFIIAWFTHSRIIQYATGARPLERKENKRVYNLVENLCISCGMKMPKVYTLDDDSLNAYASGINERSYAITLSRGLIDKLEDEELEGVIAHELTHIRNRDVRLLMVSIVFVGIFAFVAQVVMRSFFWGGGRRGKKDNTIFLLIILALAAIGWLISVLFQLAISRKREYMADAGAAQLTKRPLALASALKKVAEDPDIEALKRDDVSQLFIEHPISKERKKANFLSGIFATHPPIEKRIELLEQF